MSLELSAEMQAVRREQMESNPSLALIRDLSESAAYRSEIINKLSTQVIKGVI